MRFQKDSIIYLVVTILFVVLSIAIIQHTDLSNNVLLSKSIQIIIILFLIRISYGCTLFIKRQYKKNRYSYAIIMNLGLSIFLNINILRNISLLIENWNVLNISDIYNNTLESFSFYAMLILPCIIMLSIYSIMTNIILIKKEGFTYKNLLGIVLGVFALIGLFGSQVIYVATSKLVEGQDAIVIKKLVDVIINVTLSYFYSLILSTLYCNVMASKHIPSFDKDYVIILGSMIKQDGTLTPLLKARVDRAIEFAKMQKDKTGKDIVFIPSGGQGNDEIMSEGEAMKQYLVGQGIEEKNILVENKSTNTLENLKYSNNIIIENKQDAKVSFSTTNFHVFRSGVIASECGIDCEGLGSKTKWYFYTNALIREFIANLMHEKKKHIILLLMMNLSMLVLIWIGWAYQLI